MKGVSGNYRVIRSDFDYQPTRAEAKLESFAYLKSGWHFGEGEPISKSLLDRARVLVANGAAVGLHVDAFPGPDGSVAVAFHKGDECVEVVLNTDTTIELHMERGIGPDYEKIDERLASSLHDALQSLLSFAAETPWNSHGSSIHRVWTSSANVFRTSLSSLHPDQLMAHPTAKLVYRSSTPGVLVTA